MAPDKHDLAAALNQGTGIARNLARKELCFFKNPAAVDAAKPARHRASLVP
jgi:hypothetical protein